MKNLDNDTDLSIDEELDKDLEEIKNKINNISLDEDFKVKLKNRLDREYEAENVTSTKTRKVYFSKQLVAACACFVVLTSTVFAEQIGSFVDNLFANTYREFEEGIAAGEIQEIDMNYVEHDGISIKIDYAMKKEDSLYLVFNVLADEEFDKVYFSKFEVINNNIGKIIFKNYGFGFESVNFKCETKYMTPQNAYIFWSIDNLTENDYSNLKINLNGLKLKENLEINRIDEKWELNVDI